ncbi:MAG: ferredoxin--NADP reductase [Bacteroidetes bacterium]|nr:MAG: ferredoxin--NADP reductase [Bacteroidota bacterium]
MAIRFYQVPIDEIRDESPDAYTLFFRNPDPEVFYYQAGQYLTIKVQVGEEVLRRAFSLSSSPLTDDRLSITIKRVEGGRVSNYIRDHLQEGDTVEVLPPMGKFTVTPEADRAFHYVLIGGGSGITPLFSILKTVLQGEPESEVSLYYCNRDQEHIIFGEALGELSARYGARLHVHHTLTRPGAGWQGYTGRLDQARVYELISQLFMTSELRKQYYICGPQGLMDAAEAALDQHAVNPPDIHREYYGAPLPSEEELAAREEAQNTPVQHASTAYDDGTETYTLEKQSVQVTLYGETHTLEVKPDQYILDAANEAGLDPPFACQSGICTTCRAMLQAGVVTMDETEGLSQDELSEGYVLTCQARPLSPGVELSFG